MKGLSRSLSRGGQPASSRPGSAQPLPPGWRLHKESVVMADGDGWAKLFSAEVAVGGQEGSHT